MATRNYYTSVVMGSPGGFPLDLVSSVNCKAAYSPRQLSLADLNALQVFSSFYGSTTNLKGSQVGDIVTLANGANAEATLLYDQSGNGMTGTPITSAFRGGLVTAGVQKTLFGKQAIGRNASLNDVRFRTANDAAAISHFSYMSSSGAYDMVFVASEAPTQASFGSCHLGTTPSNGPRWSVGGTNNVVHTCLSAGATIINNTASLSIPSTGLVLVRVTQDAGAVGAARSRIETLTGSYNNNVTNGAPSGLISRSPAIFCDSNSGFSYANSATSVFAEWYAFDGVLTALEWAALKSNIETYYS